MLCIYIFFQAEDGIRDVAVTGVQTCALPISILRGTRASRPRQPSCTPMKSPSTCKAKKGTPKETSESNSRRVQFTDTRDRKSTRLNSSHGYISYAVFCLKKKKKKYTCK